MIWTQVIPMVRRWLNHSLPPPQDILQPQLPLRLPLSDICTVESEPIHCPVDQYYQFMVLFQVLCDWLIPLAAHHMGHL